jgi:hypothetical protein
MSTGPHVKEAEFLKREADQALSAAVESLNKAKEAVFHSVDPVATARRHPLLTIGGAAAAGFIATIVAIPSKHERELRQLERLQRAMHPQPPAPSPMSGGNNTSNGAPSGPQPASKPSIGSMIAKEAFAFLKPIVLALVTAKLKAEATPPPQPTDDPSQDSNTAKAL